MVSIVSYAPSLWLWTFGWTFVSSSIYVILFPHSLAHTRTIFRWISMRYDCFQLILIEPSFFQNAILFSLFTSVWDTTYILQYEMSSTIEWKFNVECMKAAKSTTIWQFNLASWDYFHINTQHWRNCIVKDRSQWSLLKTLSSLCLSYCKITGHGKDQSKLVSLSFLIKLSHF